MIAVQIHALDGQRVSLSVAVLRAPAARVHVDELLADAPTYLHPAAEWVAERDVPRPFASEVALTLDGPRGTAYAGATFRTHLYFPSTYPHAPPLVRIGSQCHHEQIDEGGLLEPAFYAALEWERKPARHVRTVVATVHQLFVSPLAGGTQLGRAARLRLLQLQRLRQHTIANYAPLRRHAPLFAPVLEPGWVEPRLLAACDARDEAAMRACVEELAPGVFCFECFSPALCGLLLDELAAFESSGLPASRPNSMNRQAAARASARLPPRPSALRLASRLPACRSAACALPLAARSPRCWPLWAAGTE